MGGLSGKGKSYKTVGRLVAKLITAELAAVDESGYVVLKSWQDLQTRFEFKRFHFHRVEFNEECKIEYVMYSVVIKEQAAKQARACQIRIASNQYLKHEWQSVAGSSVMARDVAHHQLACFVSAGRTYAQEQHYLLSLRYYKKEEELVRGDTATSTRKFNRMFGYKGHGSFTYMKRKLRDNGYVRVEHRIHKLRNGIATNAESRRTRLGFVRWDNEERVLELIQPDYIEPVSLAQLPEAMIERKKAREQFVKLMAMAEAERKKG